MKKVDVSYRQAVHTIKLSNEMTRKVLLSDVKEWMNKLWGLDYNSSLYKLLKGADDGTRKS